MRRYIYLISAVFFISLSCKVNAQATLGIFSINFPTFTVTPGSNYPVEVIIQNTGSLPYTGPVDINYHTDSIATKLLFSITTTLNPGDTLKYQTNTFQFNAPDFHTGLNIVVVWPTGNGIATSDTAVTHVTLGFGAGINEKTNNDDHLILYPNPANNKLFISFDSKSKVEQVRVYDIMGREFFVSDRNEIPNDFINVSYYPCGVYYIEMILQNGTRIKKKFIKSGP